MKLVAKKRYMKLVAGSQIANRVDPAIEKAVMDMAIEYPAYGQLRVSNELKKSGILVSPGGVRSIWLRNDLNNISKRLKALEAKMAQDGIILTESQLQVLEKRRNEKEAHGEIDTQHPGYLGCQDTYYVGNFKGIGKVYSQVFIDSYSRVADAKLYTDKTAITAADMLMIACYHGMRAKGYNTSYSDRSWVRI